MFVLLTNGNEPDTSGKKKRWFALLLLVLMIVGATGRGASGNEGDVSGYQVGYVFLCVYYYYYYGMDESVPCP